MAKPAARIAVLQVGLLVGLTAVLARAGYLQLVRAEYYRAEAARLRTATRPLPARRGTVYDRNGLPLAVSQEFHHVSVSMDQLEDTAAAVQLIASRLGVPLPRVRRAFRTQEYPYFHGPYSASQIADLRHVPGIHFESVWLRSYPSGGLARPLVGVLSDSGRGLSGMERSFDSLLAGQPGEAVFLRDGRGRLYPSPGRPRRDPTPGHDLYLTLDAELQSIAEAGLANALREFDADQGDVVFLDVHSGEVLAIASLETSRVGGGTGVGLRAGVSAISAPFEPGSTAKPFTAAALLRLGRVDSTETVSGENGVWHLPGRREPITDTHAEAGRLTLARAVQVSSNIATAKFSMRLRHEEQYEALRDFGFGSPTGIEFPGEASGRLRRPDRWREKYSGPNMAIGYEIGVTAVQLAVAYAAIANDGVLVAPTLVREVRGPAGKVTYRHDPEVVRRVISPEVAGKLRDFLREAAGDSGTGGRVQLRNFRVLGKTGTARLFENGAYQPGRYTASFAGIFPAEDPQLVVIVKLTDPRGEYGGLTAAPVTRSMLQEALAARQSALGRRLAVRGTAVDVPETPPRGAPETRVQVADLPLSSDSGVRAFAKVPDVIGLPLRQAALAMFRRGFQVELKGEGRIIRSHPEPGDSLRVGAAVTLWANPAGRNR